MTRLSAKHAGAPMTLFSDASAALSSKSDFIDTGARDSHDRVMLFGGGADPLADLALLMHTKIRSLCSACDPVRRWQSDLRPPTLHYNAKGFEAANGMMVRETAQVKPFNPDTTPNAWSGR